MLHFIKLLFSANAYSSNISLRKSSKEKQALLFHNFLILVHRFPPKHYGTLMRKLVNSITTWTLPDTKMVVLKNCGPPRNSWYTIYKIFFIKWKTVAICVQPVKDNVFMHCLVLHGYMQFNLLIGDMHYITHILVCFQTFERILLPRQ